MIGVIIFLAVRNKEGDEEEYRPRRRRRRVVEYDD
jgi:hypothetical protein